MPEQSYFDAIRDALSDEMRANPKVFILAEDGRADAATRALLETFGAERVRLAPGSAATLAGIAIGAARGGHKPVLEVAGAGALRQALGELAGHAVPPLVIRAFGAEASCSQVPGLIVAAPATAGDAAGLLRAALREPEHPVLFLQDETLHESRCEVAADGVALPFGVAAVRRVGTQLTVVSYGRLVGAAFAACELVAGEDGIDAELLDLRTLQPFDLDAILESLKKTGRLLLCSVAAADSVVCEISQSVAEQGFDDLDAPIRRVRAADAAQIAQAIRGLR